MSAARTLLLAAVVIAAVAWAQAPILDNGYALDDYLHFFQLVNFGWSEFLIIPHGGHVMFVRNGVMAVLHGLFGVEAAPSFQIAFATHLLNVALLVAVLRALGCRAGLAAGIALVWGTSGLSRGVIGWFAAYGHALVVTFQLLGILLLTRAARASRLSLGRLGAFLLLQVASAASFGVGIAFAVTSPVLVWAVFAKHPDRVRATAWACVVLVAVPALYVVLQLMGGEHGGETGTLAVLLSRPIRVVFGTFAIAGYGLGSLVLGPLIDVGVDAIAYGPFRGSSATLALVVGGATSTALVWAAARRLMQEEPETRALAAAFLLTALAGYGLIALARLPYASDFVWPLTRPRYQYGPSLALALAAGVVLRSVVFPAIRARAAWIGGFVVVVVIAAGFGRAVGDAAMHVERGPLTAASGPAVRLAYQQTLNGVRVRAMRHPEGSRVLIKNGPVGWINDVVPTALFPGLAALVLIERPDGRMAGRQLRFWSDDADQLQIGRAFPKTPIAELLVAGDPRSTTSAGDP